MQAAALIIATPFGLPDPADLRCKAKPAGGQVWQSVCERQCNCTVLLISAANSSAQLVINHMWSVLL